MLVFIIVVSPQRKDLFLCCCVSTTPSFLHQTLLPVVRLHDNTCDLMELVQLNSCCHGD